MQPNTTLMFHFVIHIIMFNIMGRLSRNPPLPNLIPQPCFPWGYVYVGRSSPLQQKMSKDTTPHHTMEYAWYLSLPTGSGVGWGFGTTIFLFLGRGVITSCILCLLYWPSLLPLIIPKRFATSLKKVIPPISPFLMLASSCQNRNVLHRSNKEILFKKKR